MAEEHITTEAKRMWAQDLEKLKKSLPPVKRVSQPASPKVVHKQQLEVARATPVVKPTVTPTVSQRPMSQSQAKPLVASVQQTEGNSRFLLMMRH